MTAPRSVAERSLTPAPSFAKSFGKDSVGSSLIDLLDDALCIGIVSYELRERLVLRAVLRTDGCLLLLDPRFDSFGFSDGLLSHAVESGSRIGTLRSLTSTNNALKAFNDGACSRNA